MCVNIFLKLMSKNMRHGCK